MGKSYVCAALAALLVAFACGARAEEMPIVWDGDSGTDLNWSTAENWAGGVAPANPAPAENPLHFLEDSSATAAGTVTAVVDPQNSGGNAGTWTVSKILVKANLDNEANKYHTLKLFDDATSSAKTLLITDDLTVSFGVFAPVDGLLGFDPAAGINLADLRNESPNCEGVLDLSNCNLVNNELVVARLTAGTNGSYWGSKGKLIIKDTTGLTKFQVVEELAVGAPVSTTYAKAYGYIGDPDSDPAWQLPPNIDILFGSETTKATVTVGASYMFGGTEGIMRASTGGTFTANVSTMIIGWWRGERVGKRFHRGTLDLSGMDECTGSIDTIEVGTIGSAENPGDNEEIKGYLGLPPGSIAATDVTLGARRNVKAGSEGKLALNGTTLTVAGGVTIYPTGVAETTVNGFSCGLDLASGAALTVNGGTINIIFAAEQDASESGEYYGLRWEGDHLLDLVLLNLAGNLTWDDTAVAGTAGVAYDGTYTYVSVRDSWPPVVMAQDVTVEIDGPTTVVVHALDADSMPGAEVDSRELSCPADTDSDPATVTIPVTAAGTYELTLTLTKGGESASDTCTLHVTDIPAGSGDDLTWSGEASLANMDRPEWLWGQNWVGGVPPANPTNATLTFADLGTGTNTIASDRSARYIQFKNPAGKHTIDLGGNTLTIIGDDEGTPGPGHIAMLPGAFPAEAEITNGTLAIGSPDAGSDLLVGTEQSSTPTLKISATLECYARDIKIGNARNSTAKLDLSDATIAGGVLRVENLLLNDSSESNDSQLILSQATGLTELVVTGVMTVGEGTYCQARIGDPANDWKLPPNTSLTLGVDGVSRGELYVARSGYGFCDGYLGGGAGGTFSAYLSRLSVGSTRNQGNPTALLDLSEMESCNIDATEIGIGYYLPPNPPAANRQVDARAYLPKGTVTTDVLKVDVETNANSSSASLLQLNGTVVSVATSAAIGRTGTIETNVTGQSCGLDLAETASLTVEDGDVDYPGGKLNIVFQPAGAGQGGVYWGLRWAGSHGAELQALADAGKLTWDDSALSGRTASIIEAGGFTYVGLNVLDGDANQDCVVNILDLIFVRNRLNQDVATGDNWQADVNGDTKINILDLIYVRNRLNTRCPE